MFISIQKQQSRTTRTTARRRPRSKNARRWRFVVLFRCCGHVLPWLLRRLFFEPTSRPYMHHVLLHTYIPTAGLVVFFLLPLAAAVTMMIFFEPCFPLHPLALLFSLVVVIPLYTTDRKEDYDDSLCETAEDNDVHSQRPILLLTSSRLPPRVAIGATPRRHVHYYSFCHPDCRK
jgi:hypothetical protein